MSDSLLLRIGEAADELRVSRSTVYSWIQAGVIPAIRIGASLRISRTQLARLIQEREREALDAAPTR